MEKSAILFFAGQHSGPLCTAYFRTDPLMEIARDTVELMRRDGKSDKEIRAVFAEKFHFSDATIDTLLGGKQ